MRLAPTGLQAMAGFIDPLVLEPAQREGGWDHGLLGPRAERPAWFSHPQATRGTISGLSSGSREVARGHGLCSGAASCRKSWRPDTQHVR